MRELKFKFWCKGTSENANFNKKGWWSYPDFLLNKYYAHFDIFESPDFVACQYTGLKNKDGKEIYEGDIVRFNEPFELSDGLFLSTLYVFEFYNGSFLRPYIYQSINGSKFINLGENKLNPTGRAKLEDNPHFDLTKAEIVGNIFETPFEIDL